jgi:predicted GIY-YIG superfamily endonuclease
MHIVYIIQSQRAKDKYYVGITNDLQRRVYQHNTTPSCSYTIKYSPWVLRTYIAFEDIEKAAQFEVYLKSHSGKAFLQKRLI